MEFSKIWSIWGAKDQSLGVFCLGGFLKSHVLLGSILFVSSGTQVWWLVGGACVCVGAYTIGLCWVELSLF